MMICEIDGASGYEAIGEIIFDNCREIICVF